MRQYGEGDVVFGARVFINITVLENDQPYGVLVFPENHVVYVGK